MIIEVSEERLAELRALSAVQLAMTLSASDRSWYLRQKSLCQRGYQEEPEFLEDGTRVIVLPKPAISQDGAAVRAALRNTHEYAAIEEAPMDALARARERWPGRELEAVRQRLVVYGRENWLALYPSITWLGDDKRYVVAWHSGSPPRPRRIDEAIYETLLPPRRNMNNAAAICRCHNPVFGMYVPIPEIERRIDMGAAAVRELLLLANCYVP